MKFMKLAVAAALAFAWSNAQAFHSGGVAECEGCHSMHNSLEGATNVTGRTTLGSGSGPWLLKASDQSGACLNCHEASPGSYHISTPGITPMDSTEPTQRTAGGDFSWLKKTMTYSVRGTLTTMDGDVKGHNIVAVDYGFTADKGKAGNVAPGGTYPVGNLMCSSCHDPHGRYRRDATGAYATTGLPIFGSGSYTTSAAPVAGVSAVGAYRLLAGVGYQPKSLVGSFAFTADPPTAVSPSSYNSNQTTIAGVGDRVGYGSGMSEYCSNCHPGMHMDAYTSGTAGLVHPAGNGAKLTAPIAANYSAYVSSGIMTGTGAQYSALAPFETGADATLAGITALKAFQAAPTAPDTTSNVLCLSCHRAHASGFESMTRYNLVNEFMTIADASNAAIYDSSTTEGKINTGYTTGQQVAAYNGRPATLFGPYARNYCNKCHAKD